MARSIDIYDIRIVLDVQPLHHEEIGDQYEIDRISLHFQENIKRFIDDYEDLPKEGFWFTGTGKVVVAELDVIEINSIKQVFTFHLLAIGPDEE
jgi:hypothetical protein